MKYIIIILFFIFLFFACRRDKALPGSAVNHGYPTEIANIMVKKCATPGCHDDISKEGASGLSLSSWDKLFEGAANYNVPVIPYSIDYSYLLAFVNTYPDIDSNILNPTMPYNGNPLKREEVIALREWIDKGAPNENGEVKFSDHPDRSKIYITNQGKDVVTVIDARSKLPMRYISVGNKPDFIEYPHMVKVSPDGKYWYVVFTAGTVIQKFDASNDFYIGQVEIGLGNWNTFSISDDGKRAFVVNWSSDGSITLVDLENLTFIKNWGGGGSDLFFYPHGITANGKYIYVTGQTGNFIYKIDTTISNFTDFKQISVDGNVPNPTTSLDIHEVIFSPDGSRYFLSCEKSNEVRVINTANDSLLKVIAIGTKPQDMSVSLSKPYLFVSCMEQDLSSSFTKGTVAVIDYLSLNKVTEVSGAFYQPHGVTVDDVNGVVYVVSRNVNPSGPAPHHCSISSGCRHGWVNLIDLQTVQIKGNYKSELFVDPFSSAIRK